MSNVKKLKYAMRSTGRFPARCLSFKAIEDKKPPERVLEAKMSTSGRDDHVRSLVFVLGAYDVAAWRALKKFRARIIDYRHQAKSSEQPFSRVRDAGIAVRRRTGRDVSFQFDENVLQYKVFILASSLLLQFDLALLVTFLSLKRPIGRETVQIAINWQAWNNDCETFLNLTEDSQRVSQQVKARIYLAQVHAIQRSKTSDSTEAERLRQAGIHHIACGRDLCASNPWQTRGLSDKLVSIESMLCESIFYSPVSNAERQAVIRAMATEMRGTGHWYYCENGHPFTIGECGMPMQTVACPDCSAPMGGRHHESVVGNRRADDLEGYLNGVAPLARSVACTS